MQRRAIVRCSGIPASSITGLYRRASAHSDRYRATRWSLPAMPAFRFSRAHTLRKRPAPCPRPGSRRPRGTLPILAGPPPTKDPPSCLPSPPPRRRRMAGMDRRTCLSRDSDRDPRPSSGLAQARRSRIHPYDGVQVVNRGCRAPRAVSRAGSVSRLPPSLEVARDACPSKVVSVPRRYVGP